MWTSGTFSICHVYLLPIMQRIYLSGDEAVTEDSGGSGPGVTTICTCPDDTIALPLFQLH
jgi:hypothetical protein